MRSVGIRREDKNEWERRVPLTPGQVASLGEAGLDFVVQPSTIRIFKEAEYRAAGASLNEDLSACGIVLGVKEMPIGTFHPGQAYMFFSHVIKGQSYNMPMLRNILERKATLIDYERVTDDQKRRLIFFGNFAGVAGMLETLYTLGRRLQWEGIPTPFAQLRRPTEYDSLEQAQTHLREIGAIVAREGLPDAVAPLIVGFTGYGNVSKGAQAIFDLLPHEEIQPSALGTLSATRLPANRVYKVVFHEKDMARPRNATAAFDLKEYFESPDRYEGIFESYLPHLSVLVNGIYWEPRFPRILTIAWLKRAWSEPKRPKLRVIGDISCDIDGSVECTVQAADPGHPVYTYLVADGTVRDGWEGEGPVIMAVDTLPAELPREASASFGGMLAPFVRALAGADYSRPFASLDLPAELKRAVVAHQGALTPDYTYLEPHVRS